MKIQRIKEWSMQIEGEEQWYPATVPGSVYQDLLDQGRMSDPYYRAQEDEALAVMEHDFIYRTEFVVDEADLAQAQEVILRFQGLDTIADIRFNGQVLGSVDNMHRTWEYPVRCLLRPGKQEITIHFHSPLQFIRERYEQDPAILGTEDAMKGFPHIRKGHYMFGWDWGPRLPDAGIWKPVELVFVEQARLTRSYIRQEWKNGLDQVRVYVESDTQVMLSAGDTPLAVFMSVQDPSGEWLCQRQDAGTGLTIEDPKLWWPNGLGEQPLYLIRIELLGGPDGRVLDTVDKRIGLRQMTMDIHPDEYGESFAHQVNGVSFFAMGADYIPEDNILSRTGPERTRTLLEQCVAAHFNCIRVWGGGLYPDDSFFDVCDELGLVVWQDFMFACANYRLTQDFEDNIMAELTDQIRRLSHHASLGLWCGNNEMEMFVDQGAWGAVHRIKSDYVKMYEYLFPKLLRAEDPDRFYWPASPSTGGGFDEPNDPNRGDVHYWDVWHGSKPFTEYRKFFFRYLSEFGFQSFPSMRTIESFTLPEDRNVFSYVMERHQRNAAANGKIMNYMEQMYLYPNSLELLVYASQLLQADAIRYGVEHFRRNRGRCMGTVYWQLNDCWPVASWSSIDYYGRWKALHYSAKRFFAPMLLSCEEESLSGQTQNVNAEPFEVKKSVRFNVSNETRDARRVTVCWQLRDASGDVKIEEKEIVNSAPFSAVWCERRALPEADLYGDYVSYQLYDGEEMLGSGSVLFCPPKHFRFVDPQLSCEIQGRDIVVTAKHYAKGVEIRNAQDDLILSDNFFDMDPGSRRVTVMSGNLEDIRLRSVYDIR